MVCCGIWINSTSKAGNKVKDKLTSCTMTGHVSIVLKLAYTSACPKELWLNANTTNTVVLQLSMRQAPYFRMTSTVPLSQHTANISTFKNMEHLRLILLVFCQQVAIRKQAGCSRSNSKKNGKSELHLLPHPKLKTRPYNVSVANS